MDIQHQELGCSHSFPDDWVFGGANGLSPMPDRRFRPVTYTYYDKSLDELFRTQMFWCDEVAIEYFTRLRDAYGLEPVYISVRRWGDPKPILIQVEYNSKEDVVYDRRP